MEWYTIKASITDFVGMSRDALHVLSGVGLQFFFVLVLRSWTGGVLPWLLVLGAAIGNEWLDLADDRWPDRSLQWDEARRDLISTLLLPTLLLLLSRFAPWLFRTRAEAIRPAEPD